MANKRDAVEFEQIVIDQEYYSSLTPEERRDMVEKELKKYYGTDAEFRDGQYEAIENVLLNKRSLVVQKTGWGKSLVYFMATRMIRKRTDGITLIISPLVALMTNQIDAAKKLDLHVETINYMNKDDWNQIYDDIADNNIDALLISPERLANSDFREKLMVIASRIAMFVVDEAHCISDWGHDFRPNYRRIIDVIKLLPSNVPVLGTTATANNRVIKDIKDQLGEDIEISRGDLIRSSVNIQTINIESREGRLAWLVNNLPKIDGTGIIYVQTTSDTVSVANYLNMNGIKAVAFSGMTDKEIKSDILDSFMYNKVKAIVATTALGMGYDKPDIAFVIHFQKPKDVISYYQQIGRAGRNMDKSLAILLYGKSDDIVNRYFIDNAFPSEEEMYEIVKAVEENDGLLLSDIERMVNIQHNGIKTVLDYLEIDGAIYKENYRYFRSAKPWKPDIEKQERITKQRYEELKVMNDFTVMDGCYMEFVARQLDDDKACKCGRCSNCIGSNLIDIDIVMDDIKKADEFSTKEIVVIKPRAQWPNSKCSEDGIKIPEKYRVEEGRILCAFEDSLLGGEILKQKDDGRFADDVIDKAVDCLRDMVKENKIKNITYIPSERHPDLVPDMARRLAEKLNLNFYEGLEVVDEAEPQHEFRNSYLKWQNVDNAIDVVDTMKGATLLVDDTVESKWTLTTCGYKLRRDGNGPIYPFALLNVASAGDIQHDVFR